MLIGFKPRHLIHRQQQPVRPLPLLLSSKPVNIALIQPLRFRGSKHPLELPRDSIELASPNVTLAHVHAASRLSRSRLGDTP